MKEIINSGSGKKDATTVNVNTSFPSDRVWDTQHPDHPRKQTRFEMQSHGAVSTGIGWDYDDDTRKPHATHNGFFVEAQPLNGSIVVQVSFGSELIPQSTWEAPGGRQVVEDAIAHAYKKPVRWARPVRIG